MPLNCKAREFEREFIDAVYTIGYKYEVFYLGEPILPIQIRHEHNKLIFLELAINQNTNLYKNLDSLVKLAEKLYMVAHLSSFLQRKLIELVARTAFHSSDFETCYLNCKKIFTLEKTNNDCEFAVLDDLFDLVCKLSMNSDFGDLQAKMELLCLALKFSGPKKCSIILSTLRTVETQISCKELDYIGCTLYQMESGSIKNLIKDLNISNLDEADFQSRSNYHHAFFNSNGSIADDEFFDYAKKGSFSNRLTNLEIILQYFNDPSITKLILNMILKMDDRILYLMESQVN